VIAEVKSQWKITLTFPALLHYNPTTAQGADLSEDLKTLFHQTRDAWRAGVLDVGVANQRYRLEMIQSVAEQAEERGALTLILASAKAAREESGAAASTGDGGAAGTPGASHANLTTAEFKTLVDELRNQPDAEQALAEKYSDMVG
jgi:hypothetical protein